MKQTILFIFISSLLLTACSGGTSNKRNADFLAPMTIQVPESIEGDAELVDLVHSSEKSINEFSDNMEQLIFDVKDFLRDDFDMEEASLMEKLQVGKAMVEFASNSTQIMTTMEKFDNYVEEKQKLGELNEKQLEALKQVGKAFESRMKEIDNKYKHYTE